MLKWNVMISWNNVLILQPLFSIVGGFGGAAGFVIYDETAADKASEEVENTENGQAEDKENM